MKKNREGSNFNILLTLGFVLGIFTTINVLVFNDCHVRKIYNSVYTADGKWFLLIDVIQAYFKDNFGLILSIIILLLALSKIIIYLPEEFKYKKEAKEIIKEVLDDQNR